MKRPYSRDLRQCVVAAVLTVINLGVRGAAVPNARPLFDDAGESRVTDARVPPAIGHVAPAAVRGEQVRRQSPPRQAPMSCSPLVITTVA